MAKISIITKDISEKNDAIAIVPVMAESKLTESGEKIKKTRAVVARVIDSAAVTGKFGEITHLSFVEGTALKQVILFGVGSQEEINGHVLRRAASLAAREAENKGGKNVTFYFSELSADNLDLKSKVQAIAEGAGLGLYKFDKYQKKESKNELESITIAVDGEAREASEKAVEKACAIIQGVKLARNLGNEPGNVCTPEFLGETAANISHPNLETTVWGKEEIEAVGFRSLMAVNQGSSKDPRFIVMRYNGGKDGQPPVALVGKGLTFDAGGISIKPSASMEEMKYDMCGSAAVLGIIKTATEINMPVNLLGVIPSTENLLGADAYKPGDVIESYKGVTIEVQNTDAEGRLILCDALAWAEDNEPEEIIDFATLTGACVVALGGEASGMMGNEAGQAMMNKISKAGEATHDRAWQLPMFDEYQEKIKSDIADIKNVGGREGGAITAGCFLSRFVDDTPWVHLDIAGTAWDMRGSDTCAKGGTGAGVRLVVEYLLQKVSGN